MRLVLIVEVSLGKWVEFCTRTVDLGDLGRLVAKLGRVVTIEAAREDYGVKVP